MFQCVPNFSEGRRTDIVEAIADTIRAIPNAYLIDYSADPDHNRCVMTILGAAEPVRRAVVAAARTACQHIDLRHHSGVHPRIGAVDVLPVVPLRNTPREAACTLAYVIGQDLSENPGLPVYFYEWSAQPGRTSALPEIRRGGFEALVNTLLTEERQPDLGPRCSHPSAGVVVVGARAPLVAYNVNLNTPDIHFARQIARQIRQQRDHIPELTGVRALGLFLESQQRAQVSLNLTHPDRTSLPAVFHYIQSAARSLGIEPCESEIIGVIPRAALANQSPASFLWHRYRPQQILETWLETLKQE